MSRCVTTVFRSTVLSLAHAVYSVDLPLICERRFVLAGRIQVVHDARSKQPLGASATNLPPNRGRRQRCSRLQGGMLQDLQHKRRYQTRSPVQVTSSSYHSKLRHRFWRRCRRKLVRRPRRRAPAVKSSASSLWIVNGRRSPAEVHPRSPTGRPAVDPRSCGLPAGLLLWP